MKKSFLADADVDVRCTACGQMHVVPFKQLKAHPFIICEGCHRSVEAEGLHHLTQAEDALDYLRAVVDTKAKPPGR